MSDSIFGELPELINVKNSGNTTSLPYDIRHRDELDEQRKSVNENSVHESSTVKSRSRSSRNSKHGNLSDDDLLQSSVGTTNVCDVDMTDMSNITYGQILSILKNVGQHQERDEFINSFFEHPSINVTWHWWENDIHTVGEYSGLQCTVVTDYYDLKCKVGKELGKGGFGTVYELLHEDTPSGLAIKCVEDNESIHYENQIIRSITHESSSVPCCLVRQREFSKLHHYTVYVMEKVDGDLDKFSSSILNSLQISTSLEETFLFHDVVLRVMDRVKLQFSCLFDNGWRYFDIKPDNIGYRLMDSSLKISILDIGSLTKEHQYDTNFPIHTYMPPEWIFTDKPTLSQKMEKDLTRTLHDSYVWLVSFTILLMFKSHPRYGNRVQEVEGMTYAHNSNQERGYIAAYNLMQEIFPRERYGDLYKGLSLNPDERTLQLSHTWSRITT